MHFPLNHFKNWQTDQDGQALLLDLQKLDSRQLKLHHLAIASGAFNDDSLKFSLLKKPSSTNTREFKVGLFYQEYSNPCACSGDDAELIDGYCELSVIFSPANNQVVISIND